jgi:hypothetical protein
MKPSELTTAVARILRDWSFEVDEIVEAVDARRPDLRASSGSELHLVEVKAKEDDAGRDEAIQAAFARGELFREHHVLAPRNRIAGIVKHASDQLLAHPEAAAAFRLIWFVSTGHKATVFLDQVEATLYGTTNLIDLDESQWFPKCYFFDNSAFFRWRHALDGAILSSESEAWFCLNTYSERVDQLRSTKLLSHFGSAVRDPVRFEAEGSAVVADCDVDRKDSAAVLGYLQKKLGRQKLMNMNLGYMSVAVGLQTE